MRSVRAATVAEHFVKTHHIEVTVTHQVLDTIYTLETGNKKGILVALEVGVLSMRLLKVGHLGDVLAEIRAACGRQDWLVYSCEV